MHINEVKNNAFYQFPQWLLKEEPYNNLGDKAKLMYMLLFDRRTLSIKNKWYDDDGQIYMYFTNEQFMQELNCSEKPIIKAKKELAEIGLLEEVRQGINKPNRLYINGTEESSVRNWRKYSSGTGESPVRNWRKYSSGTGESPVQELEKVQGINTNNINTNISILSNQQQQLSNQQQQEEVDEIRKSYDMFFEAFPKQRKNAFIQQDILADINEFGTELYQYALKLAMTNEANYPSYIERIFISWRNEGITTLEQAKQKQSKHSNSKPDKDYFYNKSNSDKPKFGPACSKY
ncbi:DnaD-like helicase loader [Streptococcus phage CHPC1045]|jgi:DnaD/phage-associated family protein|uniref:Replication initiation protein A n=2 Tax=Moineauvirus TaxID=1623304 RepID=A0A3G8F9W7_9CAUD|nr:DnaD-like helicase loader [Streptococcus phage CHPC1045]YP_010645394.1 DnaD-like helicase loader [Streptococcus phage CHPC1046]AXF53690.1 DNA replication protein [Streptococcus phage 140]AZF91647.1 replication initiation protein A [Streptococcus phage CHPC1048]AZF91601.1 replication initiation protein A [Streptococcus phage CHPC1046]AZF92640.1 replication initiation protein A [Streptococcus phage CHPC1045]